MASTCSQPVAHSYLHASTVDLGFQFSKRPSPPDARIFGCAARFNLSAMDVPASMNSRRFQVPSAVGQLLPSGCAAELSEDGEIFDSDDDDFPSVRQILASPKQVVEVIDLTSDDDGDSEGDDGNHPKISWLRYARTGSTSPDAKFALNRPLPGYRPTPFAPNRPLYQTHRHTQPTTLQSHLQLPHLAARNILGKMFLGGPCSTTNFNSVVTSLLITRALMRCTPAWIALDPPQPSSSLRRKTPGLS
jgi:hypothetical protein